MLFVLNIFDRIDNNHLYLSNWEVTNYRLYDFKIWNWIVEWFVVYKISFVLVQIVI